MTSIKLTVFLILVVRNYGQMLHRLKFVNEGANPPSNSPAQFDSSQSVMSLSNTRNKFAKADRFCVVGMWALYNTTDFGTGVEDLTTVISVRGTDITTCTRPGQIPILRNVQSLIYLGAADYSQNGILIYSQPYFLGGQWNVLVTNGMFPAGITGFNLGSLAITGSNSWLICGDTDTPCTNGVCVDAGKFGNLYMLRNPARDNSVPWPKTVRQVTMVTATDCLNYPRPTPPPTSLKLTRSRRHADATKESIIEVDIFP